MIESLAGRAARSDWEPFSCPASARLPRSDIRRRLLSAPRRCDTPSKSSLFQRPTSYPHGTPSSRRGQPHGMAPHKDTRNAPPPFLPQSNNSRNRKKSAQQHSDAAAELIGCTSLFLRVIICRAAPFPKMLCASEDLSRSGRRPHKHRHFRWSSAVAGRGVSPLIS